MKLNKICIMILTGIYIFFISMFNVKALITSHYIRDPGQTARLDISGTYANFETNQTTLGNVWDGPIFAGYGEGYIIFSYVMWNDTSATSIYSVEVISTNGINTCEIGNSKTYYDNTTQADIVTAKCYVNLSTNHYLTGFRFHRHVGAGTEHVIVSEIATWVSMQEANVSVDTGNMETGITNVENAVNNSAQNIINNIQTNTQIQNDIKNALNEDVGENYKQTPNQSDYNNYHQKENDIIGQISNTDTSAINIQNNNNANLFIWDTITRSLQSHAKVMALMISILSIGIIKLILNR